MKYNKQPIDIPQQIAILKSRGLKFRDEISALDKLSSISYFRLASYYKHLEQDNISHQFYSKSYFEDIIDIYLFDKELRSIIFNSIHDFEITLRTRIIHYFSLKYGAFWFLDESLFKNTAIHIDCLNKIDSEVKRSREDFISEHFNVYDSPSLPPVWKTLEVASFGLLSKLYCNFADTEVKKKVANSFGLMQYTYLESWLKCASVLRNFCAHHSRIWNRRFALKPQLPPKMPLHWLKNTNSTRPIKLYSQLCYLIYLEQTINPNSNTKKRIFTLLQTQSTYTLKAMGFTKDWQKEPLWQL